MCCWGRVEWSCIFLMYYVSHAKQYMIGTEALDFVYSRSRVTKFRWIQQWNLERNMMKKQ